MTTFQIDPRTDPETSVRRSFTVAAESAHDAAAIAARQWFGSAAKVQRTASGLFQASRPTSFRSGQVVSIGDAFSVQEVA